MFGSRDEKRGIHLQVRIHRLRSTEINQRGFNSAGTMMAWLLCMEGKCGM